MKTPIKLFLAIVFLLHSCQSPTKNESTSIIDTAEPPAKEEQSIDIHQKDTLPFDIEGTYIYENDVVDCKIELTVLYENGRLKYEMHTGTQSFTDFAKISQENDQLYITFQNIAWSEYLGYIDEEGNTSEKDLALPTEIMAGFRDDKIIFQNYGNAENYFLILKECDTKYIILSKQ